MSKKKKSPVIELADKGYEALIGKNFPAAGKYYEEALSHSFGVNTSLGLTMSKVQQGEFQQAADWIEKIPKQYRRFDFNRLLSLIQGYCYASLAKEKISNKFFEEYTEMVLLDADEEDEKMPKSKVKVKASDLRDFEEYDESYASSYSNKEKAENEYKSSMAFFNQYVVQIPALVQSWMTYLDGNKKWLKADDETREIIAYELLEWVRILWDNFKDVKRFPVPDPQWKELGYKCSELLLQYSPDLEEEVDNKKKILQGK